MNYLRVLLTGWVITTTKNTVMKLEVLTTSVKQEANAVLGTKEKTLYYLIIGEGETKVLINVGEKTHENVKKLTPVKP